MDWIRSNVASISWAGVSTKQDGSALPVGDVIKYRVYHRDELGNETFLVETELLNTVIDFIQEGRYIVGISSVRYVDVNKDGQFTDIEGQTLDFGPDLDETGNYVIIESDISWSDQAVPSFGYVNYIDPAKPPGLIVN